MLIQLIANILLAPVASLCPLHMSLLVIVIPVHLYSHYISFWKPNEEPIEMLRPTMWLSCTVSVAHFRGPPPNVPVLRCLAAVSLSFTCLCGMMEELSSLTGFLNEQQCFSPKLHSLIPQMPATMSSFVLKYLFFWVEEEGNPFQSCKDHFKRGLATRAKMKE